MRNLCELIARDTEQIIGRWEALCESEPWSRLSSDDRAKHLPATLVRVAEFADCHPPERARARALAEDAARYGAYRAALGIPHHLILTEYHVLRRALWGYLRAAEADGLAALAVITRIDTALSLATQASLVGYHRDQLARDGRWPAALERAVDEVPVRYGTLPG